ncbi:MAG: tRNA 2-thiouridine(34) synthase MnmA [Pirellulaceae bacterium]
MARIVLAMSGGVDSSVAAHLLLDAGHDVIGVFMRHGEESAKAYGQTACKVETSTANSTSLPVVGSVAASGGLLQQRADHKQGCCTASDAADARRVASKMNIPFYALDLQQDFKRIVDYFVDDYLSGRTPNPCVKCNHWIKFGKLFDYADGVDADFVATGHYARMLDGQLHRGRDSNKDQSYALFGIRPERLPRMMLPVGDFHKPRIREIAEELGLGVAGKKDSQEICFVTQGHHSDFVKGRRPDMVGATSGNIVLASGKVVGQHHGYEAFTVGQRKGLGVAMGSPHFVVRIETETNDVVIGPQSALERSGLTADDANWLVDPANLPENVSVQYRYNGSPKEATVKIDPEDSTRFEVVFDEPQLAISPGQAAVVYSDSHVLGGGWIE